MKLVTDLSPRANGTVVAEFGKTKYVFKPGEDGRLSADVASEGDALALLDTGNFYPAAEDDSEINLVADEAEAAMAALDAAKAEAEAVKQKAIAELSKPKAAKKK